MNLFSICVAFVIFVGFVGSENVNLVDNTIGTFTNNDMAAQILGHLVSISDRLGALDQLKAKVELLIAQSGDTNSQVLQDLRAVCAELPDVGNGATDAPTQAPTQAPVTSKPVIPFRVTRVEKTETVDHYRVKVIYEGSVQPMTMLKVGYDSPLSQLTDQRQLGQLEFNVPKEPMTNPFLSFLLPEQVSRAILKLNNTPNAIDLPRMSFEIIPGKDVMFKRGQKPTADFTFTFDRDMETIGDDKVTVYILVQSDTDPNVVNRYSAESSKCPAPLSRIKLGGRKGNRFGKVMLDSQSDVEGIVQVNYGVTFNCSENCLVRTYNDGLMVRFYREDHDGPFPRDYIGFVHEEYKSFSTRFVCQIGEPSCVVYCEALGLDISSIEITQVTPTVMDRQIDRITSAYGIWSGSVLSIRNVTFENAGDFKCTARSTTKEISEVLTLEVIKRPRIDKDLSTITRFDNGSALVTCVAEGIPRPNVTFHDDILNGTGYVMRETHPSDMQTKLEVFMDELEDTGYFYGFTCEASNVDNDRYSMYNDWYTVQDTSSNETSSSDYTFYSY